MMSATLATGSACQGSWMSVTMGTSNVVFTRSSTFSPASIPGPRKDAALVRFALSKLDLKTYSMPSGSTTCLICRHIFMMWSSDWITFGPASRKKGLSVP